VKKETIKQKKGEEKKEKKVEKEEEEEEEEGDDPFLALAMRSEETSSDKVEEKLNIKTKTPNKQISNSLTATPVGEKLNVKTKNFNKQANFKLSDCDTSRNSSKIFKPATYFIYTKRET